MKLLRPAERLYQSVAAARRSMYRRGVLKQEKAARPVISIGNLAFGGSGKTPATIAIVRLLRARGISVAILSRGYGRRTREIALVDKPDPARFGDEPAMIKSVLGDDVPVVVGRDRAAAAKWFLASSDCQLFVLDDGFQHVRLARDCDVVILNSGTVWHRETASALRDVDVVVAREGAAVPAEAAGALICDASLEPVGVAYGSQRLPLASLEGKSVVAFSALADNAQFFRSLERLGGQLAATRPFPDHHVYSDAELRRLATLASSSGALLITTAKDRVKITHPDVAVLEVEMRFADPDSLVKYLLQRCGIE